MDFFFNLWMCSSKQFLNEFLIISLEELLDDFLVNSLQQFLKDFLVKFLEICPKEPSESEELLEDFLD